MGGRMKIGAVFAAVVLVVGCGDSGGESASTDGPIGTVGTQTSSTDDPVEPVGTDTEFSVNDASEAEIEAFLTAAGIPNAATWAHEIEEYRPYDGSEADWDRLREELSKYGADEATMAKIIEAIGVGLGGAPMDFSVNDASEAEIEAFLTAAGIPNAATWAHEIEEYRPYDGSEADWDRLREELSKYGADEATMAKIIEAIGGGMGGSSADFSVNDASEAEIEAFLSAAGIPNAKTWAHEIEEYGPYDGTEADWDRLREELSKYGADQATMAKIIEAIGEGVG